MDLCALRWDQFVTHVEHAKTGCRQKWIMTPDLREVLDEARAVQGKGRSTRYVLKTTP